MYSIKNLLGNKIKPTNERFGLWLLTENLDNNNLITDVGNINYTEGEQRTDTFLPVTELFCDNIMVVKVASFADCEGDLNKQFKVKSNICGSFNSYLRRTFSKFPLARHGVKAKLPLSLDGNTKTAQGVRKVIGKNINIIRNKYNDPIVIPYKIELADVKLETLIADLPEIMQHLEKEHYYLTDLDITQDFAGIFNKEEMSEYLISNFKFCHIGEYKKDYNKIVYNNHTVGIDCLTWLTDNCRVKIYNKFICQITSPGVNKTIGNHIVDFLNCPDKRLRETFTSKIAKDRGITRLEATIYNYSIDGSEQAYNPIEDCRVLMDKNKFYFEKAPFYAVPIWKMWTKLTDTLQNSCCLVFKDLLQYVYWGNKNTRKLTGMQINLPKDPIEREKLIKYFLSAFSFNHLPINYIRITEDYTNADHVSVTHKCFIKSGCTYFTKSSTPYSTIPDEIDIQESGLVNTSNVITTVLRKRKNITHKLCPYEIKEIKPISKPYIVSAKKRKLELEEMDTKRRKIEFVEKTTAIKEEYKLELEKEQEIRETTNKFNYYFTQPWKNLDVTSTYNISAFAINDQEKFVYVGVLAESEGSTNVFYVKGPKKNAFIELNKRRDFLKSSGCLIISYTTKRGSLMDIIYLPTDKPFAMVRTNGTASYNGHTFPKIVELKFFEDVWEDKQALQYNEKDVDSVNERLIQEIKGNIKVTSCKRLEELEEGTELIITAIKEIRHRNKVRYAFSFENVQSVYISNHWLEKELQSGQIDLNYKIKVKIDKLRTTPSKHMERMVFCV